MLEITLDTRKMDRAIAALQQRGGDLRQPLTEIGEHIASEVDLTFRDGADPYGNQWDALSGLSTLKNRNGSKPLNDTGRLKSSITSNADSHSVEIGTNVEYAPTHQFGAKKGSYAKGVPWGDIPARPFLPTEEGGLPNDWGEEVLDIIKHHFQEAL